MDIVEMTARVCVQLLDRVDTKDELSKDNLEVVKDFLISLGNGRFADLYKITTKEGH